MIGKRFSVEQFHQRVPEQVRVLAVVEAPLKLIKVGVNVFLGELMVATYEARAPYLIARAFGGLPVPPWMFNGAPVNRHS